MGRPWVKDPNWFSNYARSVLNLKGKGKNEHLKDATAAVKRAFSSVYRAVAFDVDGTLTISGQSAIDSRLANIVGRLLQRGLPVILITGRGRTSSRDAAAQIKRLSGLSNWYMRRLQCVTSNGVYLLQTPTDDPSALLSIEHQLAERSARY